VTEIKFCGMTRAVDVAAAVALGAQYVGCIFAGGPRHRTWSQAVELFAAVPQGTSTRRVGVFAAGGPGPHESTAAAVPIDVVQMHGDADPAALAEVRRSSGRAVWAVMRCAGGRLPPEAATAWDAADGLLLDANVPGVLGGTGVTLPWESLAAEMTRLAPGGRPPRRLVLAGGLTPDNVGRAIALLRPDVVDVSSGIERAPGIKDAARMRAFVDAVRAADGVVAPPAPASPPAPPPPLRH
jgi:phosphoribosylanthranilate isomerase